MAARAVIDLQKAFTDETGIPLGDRKTEIDLAAVAENLDVAALAAAAPQDIVVPPYFSERENYYAGTLAALAAAKGALPAGSEAHRLFSEAGANVAASFAAFTKEPAFRQARPVLLSDPEEHVEGKGEVRPGPFHLPNPKAVYATPQVDVPAKIAALFESMRSMLGGQVEAEAALDQFRREGSARRDGLFSTALRGGAGIHLVETPERVQAA